MAKVDDAKKRSAIIAERIRKRTDTRLQGLIAEFKQPLSFSSSDNLMISPAAWSHVQSSGMEPKQVFAHPDLLLQHPETSEYYRGIALLSRKRVSAIATSVDSWEDAERRSHVNEEKCREVARLYNTVISSIIEGATDWTLENGYRNIVANMGITLDGAIRNLIGQDAENIVKERILKWLGDQGLIIKRDNRGAKFELPKDYSIC